jgi:hypothetical protein
MSAHPEHDLQVKIKQWTGENVPRPHFFFATDRRQKSAQFSHNREKMRGHVPGTPDTFLLLPGFPTIAIELKAKGKSVIDGSNQEIVGDAIRAAGHLWGWCDTVVGYYELLRSFGVQMGDYAAIKAESHDRVLLGAAIRREEAKTGVPAKARSYKPRAVKPSARALKKVAQGRWY